MPDKKRRGHRKPERKIKEGATEFFSDIGRTTEFELNVEKGPRKG